MEAESKKPNQPDLKELKKLDSSSRFLSRWWLWWLFIALAGLDYFICYGILGPVVYLPVVVVLLPLVFMIRSGICQMRDGRGRGTLIVMIPSAVLNIIASALCICIVYAYYLLSAFALGLSMFSALFNAFAVGLSMFSALFNAPSPTQTNSCYVPLLPEPPFGLLTILMILILILGSYLVVKATLAACRTRLWGKNALSREEIKRALLKLEKGENAGDGPPAAAEPVGCSRTRRILAGVLPLAFLVVLMAAMPKYSQLFLTFANAAEKKYRIDAENGDVEAQCKLGECYECGRDAPKWPEAAAYWYGMAADKECGPAQDKAGELFYEHGDYNRAAKYLRISAGRGSASAQYKMGEILYWGRGKFKRDPKSAVEYFSKAAGQNLAEAQYRLGMCYLNGDGVKENPSKAVEYLSKAAGQNLAEAQYRLGMCYLNGDGVKENRSKAVEYLSKAAGQGNQYAELMLKTL